MMRFGKNENFFERAGAVVFLARGNLERVEYVEEATYCPAMRRLTAESPGSQTPGGTLVLD